MNLIFIKPPKLLTSNDDSHASSFPYTTFEVELSDWFLMTPFACPISFSPGSANIRQCDHGLSFLGKGDAVVYKHGSKPRIEHLLISALNFQAYRECKTIGNCRKFCGTLFSRLLFYLIKRRKAIPQSNGSRQSYWIVDFPNQTPRGLGISTTQTATLPANLEGFFHQTWERYFPKGRVPNSIWGAMFT